MGKKGELPAVLPPRTEMHTGLTSRSGLQVTQPASSVPGASCQCVPGESPALLALPLPRRARSSHLGPAGPLLPIAECFASSLLSHCLSPPGGWWQSRGRAPGPCAPGPRAPAGSEGRGCPQIHSTRSFSSSEAELKNLSLTSGALRESVRATYRETSHSPGCEACAPRACDFIRREVFAGRLGHSRGRRPAVGQRFLGPHHGSRRGEAAGDATQAPREGTWPHRP